MLPAVINIGLATATDLVDGVLAATRDNPGPFPAGETIVTWTAEDAAGNEGIAAQIVEVNIATPNSS